MISTVTDSLLVDSNAQCALSKKPSSQKNVAHLRNAVSMPADESGASTPKPVNLYYILESLKQFDEWDISAAERV